MGTVVKYFFHAYIHPLKPYQTSELSASLPDSPIP